MQSTNGSSPIVIIGGGVIGSAIAWGLAIVGTLLILKVVDATIGLRMEKEHEIQGMDITLHGEEGYILEG